MVNPLWNPGANCIFKRQSEVEVKLLSRVQLFVTPWTVVYEAPLSMEFSRQEYWSGLPFPSPGDLPGPGIKLRSPTLQADALLSEPPGKLKRHKIYITHTKDITTWDYWWLYDQHILRKINPLHLPR